MLSTTTPLSYASSFTFTFTPSLPPPPPTAMSVDPIAASSPPPSPSPSPSPPPPPLSANPNFPDPPPTRKVPPPCWTPDETFALVHAYRDRWFSLRRRNLRSPDWDAVAADVSRRCPASFPPKSSVQCRHKIEKLRKRYRSEKQRSLAFPARFSSSWDLFPLLDSMEIAVVGSPQEPPIANVPAFRLKASLPQGLVVRKHGKREEGNSSPNLDYEGGFGVRVVDDRNLVTTAFGSKNYAKIYGGSSSDHHFDNNSSAGYGVQIIGTHSSVPGGLRMRNQSKVNGNYASNLNFDYGQGVDSGCGFPLQSLGNRNLMPSGVRSRNYNRIDGSFDAKLNHHDHSDDCGNDKDGGFYPRISGDRLVPSGIRSMSYNRVDGSSASNVDSGAQSGSGVKRKVDPIAEMVSSIKMLGKGFIQMEEKKMEMAREIEKMRMDAEMKRNEMIIKSQQQILDVFINALYGKTKKVKMEEPSHS